MKAVSAALAASSRQSAVNVKHHALAARLRTVRIGPCRVDRLFERGHDVVAAVGAVVEHHDRAVLEVVHEVAGGQR